MRRRVQISFLSAFLTLLTVAFAAALVVRVRSYSGPMTTESSASAATAAGTRAAARSNRRTDGLSGDDPLPTGSTVSTQGGSTASNATAAAARAKRFQELLALGAPKLDAPVSPVQAPVKIVPVPVVAKVQTPVSRPPQAAANAFRGSGASGSAGSNGPPSSNNKPNTPTNDPKDPNSDTVPPQLISIAFDPPQVSDGGDTTLVVNATDDLSGIRGISGTLTSPNGKAVQGFAQQREGETTRYVSRIHIPEKAEEGFWKITFLTMSDMATNSVTLSAGQGTLPPTAVLKVTSSASDSTAPTLRNVWLARGAMRAGEHNTLYVDAQDDKSGVHLVAAVFLSPSKLARFGVGCHTGADNVWECDVFPPTCLDCGDWTLEQVQLQDNANNFATIRSENPAVQSVRLNITGDTCDNQPPVLQGLALSRTEIVMGRDEPVIEFVAQVSDDSCGIGGVSGQIVGPGGNSSGTFFSLQQRDATTYVGTVRLHTNSARGVWRVQSITVNDKGQNLKIYYANDPLLANAIFRVK
ncbi:MAG TPA: hypothetical protein VNN25_15300 [Thermoanaerobaculia bacterium]|nr:hypothetical protein [Thermoanaerobaculia bacterium]